MKQKRTNVEARIKWRHFSLRGIIYLILFGQVVITVLSCLVIVWHNHKIETLLYSIMEEDLVAYQIAENLETALINQKGFLSYFFLDKNPDWLKQLGEHRQIFKERLIDANRVSKTNEERAILARVNQHYLRYINLKDQVIEYYTSNEDAKGAELHKTVRQMFFTVLAECDRYKTLKTSKMRQASLHSYKEAERLRLNAGVLVVSIFSLSLLLVLILARRILDPLRRMTQESNRVVPGGPPLDEVKTLDRNIKGLLLDVGRKTTILEESRQHLKQSEKMALVGKLAAGMAHSVRNPLTSVKMRLFTLNRTVQLTENQQEDFQVIKEEIQHIDTIVQNFLEFSRPPKLRFQRISPSVVVDLALQLLEHRLKSYNVEVTVIRHEPLPEIDGDPEQLKEVIVNLVINACEAMNGGGNILIEEVDEVSENRRLLTIRLQDNGPGIQPAIRDKIFQPFFTTKEEGTGLGLSIASRIIEEHNGYLECSSELGIGSLFTINFIINGDGFEKDTNH